MRRLIAQITACIAVALMAMPVMADDGQIAKQIIGQLQQQKQSANLQGFDLGVQVDGGTVTMMGQVASPEQAMLALDTARRIPGVKLVVNDLYVNAQSAAAQPTQAPMVARTPQQPQAIRPVAAQQPIAYQQPAMAQYNMTGAVGSAVRKQPRMQMQQQPRMQQRPVAMAPSMIQRASAQSPVRAANYVEGGASYGGAPSPSYGGEVVGGGYGGGYGGGMVADKPQVPGYSWPSYAASPNYGAVSYPEQYSATAWPYIGPFYPYPQVPLGWRKVSLEWDDGWWNLDFTKK